MLCCVVLCCVVFCGVVILVVLYYVDDIVSFFNIYISFVRYRESEANRQKWIKVW